MKSSLSCIPLILSEQVQQSSSQVSTQEEEDEIEKAIRKYIGDDEVMDYVGDVKGGPSSAAYLGMRLLRR